MTKFEKIQYWAYHEAADLTGRLKGGRVTFLEYLDAWGRMWFLGFFLIIVMPFVLLYDAVLTVRNLLVGECESDDDDFIGSGRAGV